MTDTPAVMTLLPRRLAAFALDTVLLAGSIAPFSEPAARFVPWPVSLVAAALPGIALLGMCAGRWGGSPGKLIAGLRIVAADGSPVRSGKAMVREAIKFLSLPVAVLPILYLVALSQRGATPYDEFLRLRVQGASQD